MGEIQAGVVIVVQIRVGVLQPVIKHPDRHASPGVFVPNFFNIAQQLEVPLRCIAGIGGANHSA